MTVDLKQQGPYTAEGGYNIRTPDGNTLIFQGGFERDEIRRLLNAAYQAGQQSATPQGISEEEIERIANKIVPNEDCQVVHITEWGHLPVSKGENIRIHIAAALRYARDNFGIRSPSTGEARIAELEGALKIAREVAPYAYDDRNANLVTNWNLEVTRHIKNIDALLSPPK